MRRRKNLLAEVRINQEMSQEQLAHKAQLSVFTISRLERQRDPTHMIWASALRLADALGTTTELLFPEIRP